MTDLALPYPRAARVSPGHLRALPDARLSRLAADGDERAFTAIVRRHQTGLYRYCLAILRHREDAGDAVQAALTKALLAIPAKKPEVPLKPWLYRIAHNESISIRRRGSNHAGGGDDRVGSAPGADERAFDRDELRQLVDDLLALPERQRAALVMRELNGLDYGEIGTSLGTSTSTAKQTVYEARLALLERARGRETSCERIRLQISEGDRRVLRGRRVAAHLLSCASCREFEQSIRHRAVEIQALAPIGSLGILGVLKGLIGGGGGGGGGTGGGGALAGLSAGGATISSGAALKSAAALATLLVATGAAEMRDHGPTGGAVGGESPVAVAASSQPGMHLRSSAMPAPSLGGQRRHAADAGRRASSPAGGDPADVLPDPLPDPARPETPVGPVAPVAELHTHGVFASSPTEHTAPAPPVSAAPEADLPVWPGAGGSPEEAIAPGLVVVDGLIEAAELALMEDLRNGVKPGRGHESEPPAAPGAPVAAGHPDEGHPGRGQAVGPNPDRGQGRPADAPPHPAGDRRPEDVPARPHGDDGPPRGANGMPPGHERQEDEPRGNGQGHTPDAEAHEPPGNAFDRGPDHAPPGRSPDVDRDRGDASTGPADATGPREPAEGKEPKEPKEPKGPKAD